VPFLKISNLYKWWCSSKSL